MIKFKQVKRIHLELSSACNAACPSCPRNVDGGYTVPWLKQHTMSLNDFKIMFDESLLTQLETILLCGNFGDPVYCVDLPNILRYIHQINPRLNVVMHTNGGIRSPMWWNELAQCHDNFRVIFSIDGLINTNHLYRIGVKWDRVIENATTFIENGGEATWEFLIFRHNEHQIGEARDLAKTMNFKEFKLKRPFGFETLDGGFSSMRVVDKEGKFSHFIYEAADKDLQNKAWSSESDSRKTYNIPPATFKQHIDSTFNHVESYLTNELNKYKLLENNDINCMSQTSAELYVDSEGDLFPCCFLGIAKQRVNNTPEMVQVNKWLDSLPTNALSLKHHSMNDILDTNIFDDIANNWASTHCDGRFLCCTKMCSKNTNFKEKLYVK